MFNKSLIALCSPQNGCFAEDGAILYPSVPNYQPATPGSYHFVQLAKTNKRSKFGWVKSCKQSFTLEEFLAGYPELDQSDEQRALLNGLFEAMSKLQDDTPVAVTFFRRGLEHPRLELTSHRVFFYSDSHHLSIGEESPD